ncbi:MAG: hypothetical protein JJ896_13130 [Rhodothermales bacterium]|nr:hypothetical protein [Rhodothermales bacterium]MBO6780589.1 hypothetical protein [Rhodothermales bacterium]
MTDSEFLRRVKAELGRAYHDISNPLAIVQGNLELIAELRKAGAPPEELLDSIDDAHAALAGFHQPMQHLMTIRRLIDERLENGPE